MNHFDSKQIFNHAASPKRPAPFSLRLSFEERSELERLADGMPLGAFIKSRIFVGGAGSRLRTRQVDRKALAKILAAIGRSRVPQNLSQIARAANTGTLPVTPELEEELHVACGEIVSLRAEIMSAIGKREV